LITADGRRLRVDTHDHPDLAWALRGGGGNFGVVTRFDLELAPVQEVLGGAIGFRVGAAGSLAAFLTRYRDFMAGAPDALAVELSAFDLDGPVIAALVCWSGPPEAGAPIVETLRSFGPPIFDHVRPVAFAHLTDRPDAPSPPPFLFWRGASLDALSAAAAQALEAQVRAAPPGWSLGLGHVMRGQITRIADNATPFVRRPGQAAFFFGAGWGDPAAGPERMDWVRRATAALAPWSSAHGYINYLSDDRPAAVAAAYGASYARLQAVKRRYDPDNVFRRNRNIAP
jgi:FAD/FMN-containing dehydrogenase